MIYDKYMKVIHDNWFKLNFIIKSSRRLNTISNYTIKS